MFTDEQLEQPANSKSKCIDVRRDVAALEVASAADEALLGASKQLLAAFDRTVDALSSVVPPAAPSALGAQVCARTQSKSLSALVSEPSLPACLHSAPRQQRQVST